MPKLYHADVYVPPTLSLGPIRPGLVLTYGAHARRAALDDGIKALPRKLPTFKLVEVEADDLGIVKTVVRIPYDATRDAVLVVLPNGFVKTVWLNATDDQHATLNKSRYATN